MLTERPSIYSAVFNYIERFCDIDMLVLLYLYEWGVGDIAITA